MTQAEKRIKAEERVQELKEFYKHLILFVIINVLFTFICQYFNAKIRVFGDLIISNKITDNGFEYYPLWGVILLIDAFKVFVFKGTFAKNWEERKIQEYIHKNE